MKKENAMRKLNGLLFTLLLLACLPVQAALEIRITQGIEDAYPIAVAPFVWSDDGQPPLAVDQVVSADLRRSGQFSPVARERFPQPDVRAENLELYRWREKKIDYVVVGAIKAQAPDFYRVEFRLFDSVKGQQLAGYAFSTDRTNLRQTAHQIADLIYEAILGIKGAFNTRIVYITTRGQGAGKRYIMQVADSDGYNARTILNARKPLMSPDWSPDARRIAYVSFENNRAAVYIQDVLTGERRRVSNKPGINGAPSWSPDGRRLALTLSGGGSPDIYVLDIDSGRLTRLTTDRAIDTEPVWMPDGQSIVFTSDRSGSPQLYRVPVSGGAPQRLTFEGDYNASADVSPDGRKIAMVNGDRNRFRIAVLDLETGDTQVLTNGRLDESPSFAPNGSMIIYATEERGRGVLAAVSVDGRVRQVLVLKEGEVREPDWSPFLNP